MTSHIGHAFGDIFEDMVLGYSRRASAIEARRATDSEAGVVEDESAVANGETPNLQSRPGESK